MSALENLALSEVSSAKTQLTCVCVFIGMDGANDALRMSFNDHAINSILSDRYRAQIVFMET